MLDINKRSSLLREREALVEETVKMEAELSDAHQDKMSVDQATAYGVKSADYRNKQAKIERINSDLSLIEAATPKAKDSQAREEEGRTRWRGRGR